jgi:DNA polymerase-3 subunit delta'
MRVPGLAGNAAVRTLLSGRTFLGAYIIAGPEGVGKRTLARLIAAAMVCTDGENRPCLSCVPCRKALGGTHPDIIHVENEGKGAYVDQIREMRSSVHVRPNEADRKVFIIHDAQEMNSSAQNAMLRVLEDGPSYASFLLLAENVAALLPTVRSRCMELLLSPVTAEEAFCWLQGRFPDREQEELRRASARCEGILGRAVKELETAADGNFKAMGAAA